MRFLKKLSKDRRGVAALEFALVAPPLFLIVIGTVEIGIATFIGATLESAVLEASRFGITGSSTSGISRAERVREIVADKTLGLIDMDEAEIETLVYQSFENIGQPEPFTDQNSDGAYNSGEPYTDVNGNGQWDADMGQVGLGGPGDVVIYRIAYDWGIVTPLMRKAIGESITQTASIAVRNEPF